MFYEDLLSKPIRTYFDVFVKLCFSNLLLLCKARLLEQRQCCICNILWLQIWEIPDGGLLTTMTEPYLTLNGHERKVTLIVWHPTADNILISGGIFKNVMCMLNLFSIFW